MWKKAIHGETESYKAVRSGYELAAYYIPKLIDGEIDACDYFLTSPKGKNLLAFRICQDGSREDFDTKPTPYVVRRCTN